MNRTAIGFIGLGVMGEPMCRNMARKSGRKLIGYDRAPAPLERLASVGVEAAESLQTLAASCSLIFLALPSGKHVEAICSEDAGLLGFIQPGTLVVDLGTSPVDLARSLAERLAARGARFADAPIARTRQAAEDGTLSIMVGADEATFHELAPILATLATDITHCGAVGAGQTVKIMNNMILVETVVALSEATAVARRAGLDPEVLYRALSRGSADSFALRNHGLKAILPESFPTQAFSTDYALKDLSYALALGAELGLDMKGAKTANALLEEASRAGWGDLYWPVVSRVLNGPANRG